MRVNPYLLDLNYQMDGEKIKLEVDKVDSCPLSENEFCLKSIAFKVSANALEIKMTLGYGVKNR